MYSVEYSDENRRNIVAGSVPKVFDDFISGFRIRNTKTSGIPYLILIYM